MILLWQIAVAFLSLSLVAVGGATAVVPEMHRQVVDMLHWMSDATFTELFAISQMAPGPNILMVSLVGWHMAGAAGLCVATMAMILPSSLLAFTAGRLITRFSEAPALRKIQGGLVPIAVALILATGLIMARAAYRDLLDLAITAATALFIFATRRNPLWALAAGAAIGMLAHRLA